MAARARLPSQARWWRSAWPSKELQAQRSLKVNPLKDYLAAISVGIVGEEMLLDLSYAEDSSAEVDMNVVMTGAGRLVETQATAEGRTFSVEDLNKLIELARPAINHLIEVQKSILKAVTSDK